MSVKNRIAPPRLIADIGGTNARFALVYGDDPHCATRVLRCADYAEIVDAVEAYLAGHDGPRPLEAAFAMPNPVAGDRIKMTNHSWEFSIDETRRRLGFENLLLINDFTAQAMALPYLDPAGLRQIGGGKPVAKREIGVLGPGTGLGVSGLVHAGDRWTPLMSEGGHVSISPGNAREIAIFESCMARFGHVSAERLISGMGLQNLHHAISGLNGLEPESLAPSEISGRALAESDPICAEVLEVFCALLGSTAGNLALTLGATGGIYIGGGIVPRLGEYFERSPFRQRFEDKGRFSNYLGNIPTYVIHTEYPALIGVSRVYGPYASIIEDLQPRDGAPQVSGA